MVTSVEEACEVRTDLPPFRLKDPGRCSFESYSSGSMEKPRPNYPMFGKTIYIKSQAEHEINKSCQMQ
jgi:hypothetical protein